MCTLRENCGVSVSLQLFSANYIQLSFQCNFVYDVVVSISILITMDSINLCLTKSLCPYVEFFGIFILFLRASETFNLDYVDLNLYYSIPMLNHLD